MNNLGIGLLKKKRIMLKVGQNCFMEGHDQFYGRAEPFLWKGKTTFMEGQDHISGRAGWV